jgi:hypothetical protein
MLSAAFDAGGSKRDQSVLVVAGFVSSVDDWSDFDKLWKARLAEDGLAYFHAQNFAQSSGPFKDGWKSNESRRISLLSDLMGIVKSHCYTKIASMVVNDIHATEMSPEIRQRFHLEAFPLAARTAAIKVKEFAIRFGARIFPEFVFEDGDLDKGLMIKRFETDRYPTPIFRAKKDTLDEHTGRLKLAYTPLQAADWLAYELFLAKKKSSLGVDLADFRWAYKEFEKMQGEPGIYLASNIQRLDDMLAQQASGKEIIRDPSNGAYLLPRYVQ